MQSKSVLSALKKCRSGWETGYLGDRLQLYTLCPAESPGDVAQKHLDLLLFGPGERDTIIYDGDVERGALENGICEDPSYDGVWGCPAYSRKKGNEILPLSHSSQWAARPLGWGIPKLHLLLSPLVFPGEGRDKAGCVLAA